MSQGTEGGATAAASSMKGAEGLNVGQAAGGLTDKAGAMVMPSSIAARAVTPAEMQADKLANWKMAGSTIGDLGKGMGAAIAASGGGGVAPASSGMRPSSIRLNRGSFDAKDLYKFGGTDSMDTKKLLALLNKPSYYNQ